MIVVNGRSLGVNQNGVFNATNTDSIPGGSLWNGYPGQDAGAAASWIAMRNAYVADGGHPGDFEPLGPNSSARSRAYQDQVWDLYQHHNGNPAAQPYTSNHGWGIAVDVATVAAANWIRRNGAKFGWSWDEGKRVGEWWHFRYLGGFKGEKVNPFSGYTASEARWIKEYDHLVTTNSDKARRKVLRRVMGEQRERIWHNAQDKKGWTRLRKKRYSSLKARS